MKLAHTVFTMALLGVFILTAAVSADVPTVMNYQGKLTDAAGNPVADGPHNVVFKIYDPSYTEVWSESHSVQTTDGLFSVVLGSNGSPLSPDIFAGDEVYLGISVGGDPELTPLVRLTSVPYAFHSGDGGGSADDGDWIVSGDDLQSAVDGSVGIGVAPAGYRLDVRSQAVATTSYAFRATSYGTNSFVRAIFGYSGGTGLFSTGVQGAADGAATTNIGVRGLAYNGSYNYAGWFTSNLGTFDMDDNVLTMLDTTIVGSGQMTTFGPTGSANVQLWSQPGFPDHGRLDVLGASDNIRVWMFVTNLGDGMLGVSGATGSSNHVLTSRANNADRGYLGVCDENSIIRSSLLIGNDGYGDVKADRLTIDADGGSGDNWVMLPNSSVNSYEMLNEPGIAQGKVTGQVHVSGQVSMIDIVTVSITIPEPGYVVLEASAQAALVGTLLANFMSVQIDKNAAGGINSNYYQNVGWGSSSPTAGIAYLPVAIRRTYYESSAGTHTYRFEALDGSMNGSKYMWNPVITATYHPTSYGSVTTVASSGKAGQFDDAQLVTGGDNGDGIESRGTGYLVDLRELELKAARAREVVLNAERTALRAERELLQAQMPAATNEAAQE